MTSVLLPRPGSPLSTDRLVLSSLTVEDLPELYDLHADPRTYRWDPTPPVPSLAVMARVLERWIADRDRQGFGYAALRTAPGRPPGTPGELIGVCGLTELSLDGDDVVSVYYRLRPDAWGRGLASEALRALLAQADAHLAGREAVIVTDPANAPSLALAGRRGFRPRPAPSREHPGLVVLTRPLGPVVAAPHRPGPGAQNPAGAGRYAPSPSGDLHLGNLRTALLAWALARRTGRAFHLRVEDLDRVQEGSAERQLEDLAALGITWDGPVVLQSDRAREHDAAIARLDAEGLVYECYCTRREILEAPSAPHAPPGAYPGTCRDLDDAERAAGRERMRALDRRPALRLRAGVTSWEVTDLFAGTVVGAVDDVVLRRGDGVVAYNLAVVVDDAAAGVDQVVRADDLLSSAPRQAYLAHLLGLPAVGWAHVPLAVTPEGRRLAKRDGAVTLRDRLALGEDVGDVLERIGLSVGLTGCRSVQDLLDRWDPTTLAREPWVVDLPDGTTTRRPVGDRTAR